MSTAAEYNQLLSQRDELWQHIGGLFEDPPSKQCDALVSYLSGELQHISRLCQDSLFSQVTAVSASALLLPFWVPQLHLWILLYPLLSLQTSLFLMRLRWPKLFESKPL